jgi:hypothetical protein
MIPLTMPAQILLGLLLQVFEIRHGRDYGLHIVGGHCPFGLSRCALLQLFKSACAGGGLSTAAMSLGGPQPRWRSPKLPAGHRGSPAATVASGRLRVDFRASGTRRIRNECMASARVAAGRLAPGDAKCALAERQNAGQRVPKKIVRLHHRPDRFRDDALPAAPEPLRCSARRHGHRRRDWNWPHTARAGCSPLLTSRALLLPGPDRRGRRTPPARSRPNARFRRKLSPTRTCFGVSD